MFHALCTYRSSWPSRSAQERRAALPRDESARLSFEKITPGAGIASYDRKQPMEPHDLQDFSLEGKERKNFRNMRNRFKKEGFSFIILGKSEVPGVLLQLEEISNDWLREKNTRGKRFSLGRFSPEYMRCFPCAVIRKGDSILAFSNLCSEQEKEKFDPVWKPKYLTCTDGLTVPKVVANIASLISGGVRGVLAK